MKFGVVVFPGSNCDRDCMWVLKEVIGVETEFIWHEQRDIYEFDCVVLPGGFSYGDYLRAGAIAKVSPVVGVLRDYIDRGGLVIGICNGFQILLEAGLLPGAMLRNKNLKFICEFVEIVVENNKTPFTCELAEGEILKIPIAHMEGNYFVEEYMLERLIDNKQIVFRYHGYNPNGSVYDIAGITDMSNRVLGMMPHPERCCEDVLGSTDGLKIFSSIVKWIAQNGRIKNEA